MNEGVDLAFRLEAVDPLLERPCPGRAHLHSPLKRKLTAIPDQIYCPGFRRGLLRGSTCLAHPRASRGHAYRKTYSASGTASHSRWPSWAPCWPWSSTPRPRALRPAKPCRSPSSSPSSSSSSSATPSCSSHGCCHRPARSTHSRLEASAVG